MAVLTVAGRVKLVGKVAAAEEVRKIQAQVRTVIEEKHKMKHKSSMRVVLLLVLFISLGCRTAEQSQNLLAVETSAKQTEETKLVTSPVNPDDQGDRTERSHTVVAYYFHRTFRCPSCLAIEALSLEALQSGFEQALRDGALEWLTVNIDEPGGEDFVNDFDLSTSSLVIADMQNGKQVKWKKLEEVWKLKDDRDAFVKYVQDEVATYLASD